MKLVIQRVKYANVEVDNQIVGSIDNGLLVYLGIADFDNISIIQKAVKKIQNLRIFQDSEGMTNLNSQAVNGQLLVVSQFTLYADISHGNRPSFTSSAKPDYANQMYELFLKECEGKFSKVQHGIFGADMAVTSLNDGPFTIIMNIDSQGNISKAI